MAANNVYSRKALHKEIFSPFSIVYFNESFDFCEYIKRINNADLFSQPSLIIFTKDANSSDILPHSLIIGWIILCCAYACFVNETH